MSITRQDLEALVAAEQAASDARWSAALLALVADWTVAAESYRKMADMVKEHTGRHDTEARGCSIMLEVASHQVRELVERMEEGQ